MSAVVASKLRILVVDDEPSVGNTVKMLLKFDGHEVELTNCSKEALSMFKSGRFDLVFTDLTMPGMNGHQLAAAIKAGSPNQPIVMITAYAGTLHKSPNVDFVVSKPFRLENLREAIANVMPEASLLASGHLASVKRPPVCLIPGSRLSTVVPHCGTDAEDSNRPTL
jgi:CheY-like chemotaxis protein